MIHSFHRNERPCLVFKYMRRSYGSHWAYPISGRFQFDLSTEKKKVIFLASFYKFCLTTGTISLSIRISISKMFKSIEIVNMVHFIWTVQKVKQFRVFRSWSLKWLNGQKFIENRTGVGFECRTQTHSSFDKDSPRKIQFCNRSACHRMLHQDFSMYNTFAHVNAYEASILFASVSHLVF